VPSLSYRPERIQVPKSSETRAGLEKALSKNVMFSHLERDQLSQIFAAMFEVKYNANDLVYRQGMLPSLLRFRLHSLVYRTAGDEGDNFYVVDKGECDVYAIKAGVSQHVAAYEVGSAFGELALIYDSPRASTVKVLLSPRLFDYVSKVFVGKNRCYIVGNRPCGFSFHSNGMN
jgi:cAMP-dependent protein kinase regulator